VAPPFALFRGCGDHLDCMATGPALKARARARSRARYRCFCSLQRRARYRHRWNGQRMTRTRGRRSNRSPHRWQACILPWPPRLPLDHLAPTLSSRTKRPAGTLGATVTVTSTGAGGGCGGAGGAGGGSITLGDGAALTPRPCGAGSFGGAGKRLAPMDCEAYTPPQAIPIAAHQGTAESPKVSFRPVSMLFLR
jgi:hypothetical protein